MSRILSNRATRDAIVLVAIGLLLYLIGVRYDAMDFLFDFASEHEEYEVDEIFLAVIATGVMGFIYAFRRMHDLGAEIARRHKAEADTTWIAQHDILTRLPNRRLLDKFVTDVAAGREAKARHVVFAIDLDGFKKVNDLLGHHGGNDLLVEVARRMKQMFPDDLVVRLGGDEFAVIAESRVADEPLGAGRKLIDAISLPMTIGGIQVQVGASVGIAIYPEQAGDLNEALRLADIALYSAKKHGRGAVTLFEPSENGRSAGATHRGRDRAAQGYREPRDRAALSAAGRSSDRPHKGLRSPGALEHERRPQRTAQRLH